MCNLDTKTPAKSIIIFYSSTVQFHFDDYANNIISRVEGESESGHNLLPWQMENLCQTPAGLVHSWDPSVIPAFKLFGDEQTS